MLHHNWNILSFDNGSRFRYLIAGTAENRKGGLAIHNPLNLPICGSITMRCAWRDVTTQAVSMEGESLLSEVERIVGLKRSSNRG
jgi:hypothetical protein